jgi:hypothetical protein
MDFLKEDLKHLFDDQGVDVSKYDESVDFQVGLASASFFFPTDAPARSCCCSCCPHLVAAPPAIGLLNTDEFQVATAATSYCLLL